MYRPSSVGKPGIADDIAAGDRAEPVAAVGLLPTPGRACPLAVAAWVKRAEVVQPFAARPAVVRGHADVDLLVLVLANVCDTIWPSGMNENRHGLRRPTPSISSGPAVAGIESQQLAEHRRRVLRMTELVVGFPRRRRSPATASRRARSATDRRCDSRPGRAGSPSSNRPLSGSATFMSICGSAVFADLDLPRRGGLESGRDTRRSGRSSRSPARTRPTRARAPATSRNVIPVRSMNGVVWTTPSRIKPHAPHPLGDEHAPGVPGRRARPRRRRKAP